MDIAKEIGLPAMLEQTAEECNELAQACLKLARKLRNENPTPRTEDEIKESINEEFADVSLCAGLLSLEGIIDLDKVESIGLAKGERWEKRIEEHKKNKEKCL